MSAARFKVSLADTADAENEGNLNPQRKSVAISSEVQVEIVEPRKSFC